MSGFVMMLPPGTRIEYLSPGPSPKSTRLRLAIERFCRRIHRAERRARAGGLSKVAERLRGLRSASMNRRLADTSHPLIDRPAGVSDFLLASFLTVLRKDVGALPQRLDLKLAGFLLQITVEAIADLQREQGRSS